MTKTLIQIISSLSWGGPERYALDICRHFKAEGWRVRVLTREVSAIDSRITAAGVSLRHAPLRDYPDFFSAMILRHTLRRIPEGEGIVHVHNFDDALTAVIARKLARRPDIRIVVTSHQASRPEITTLTRWLLPKIDALVFVSEFSRNRFLTAWPDGKIPYPEPRIHVTYNSLYLPEDFTPAPEPEKGPVTAMYCGTLRQGKGLETLIDSLSLLKDLRLRLRMVGSGDPDYVDALRRRALLRGVMEKIDWTRKCDDAFPLIAEAHFGVFPSVEPEAFGMSNLEFMAMGRPQISTMLGGQKEFLTDGKDALEINPASARSLAEAMRQLATDHTLRQSLAREARREYTTRFTWQSFIRRLSLPYDLQTGRKES